MGAYEYFDAPYVANGLYNGVFETCTQFPVRPDTTLYIDTATCHSMVKLFPNGSSSINGLVQVCVRNEATVQFVNGNPYVQRYYNIIPQTNAAGATARVTIYYTQSDFTNYNTAAPSFPQLPTGPLDAAGIANIRIEQDHGISLTGVPGTYNGTTVFIDPVDADIIWNAANNIWEVSFEVNGFSGFFMRTLSVVPVTLVQFSLAKRNNNIYLEWATTSEINTKEFCILKSANGVDFNSVGTVPASNNSSGDSYNFTDTDPVRGINYFKLSIANFDGSKNYSKTLSLKLTGNTQTDILITPNPVTAHGMISILGELKGNTLLAIYDMDGRKIKDIFSGILNVNAFSLPFDITGLVKGIYLIHIMNKNLIMHKKFLVN